MRESELLQKWWRTPVKEAQLAPVNVAHDLSVSATGAGRTARRRPTDRRPRGTVPGAPARGRGRDSGPASPPARVPASPCGGGQFVHVEVAEMRLGLLRCLPEPGADEGYIA